jgi:hypothetical protein
MPWFADLNSQVFVELRKKSARPRDRASRSPPGPPTGPRSQPRPGAASPPPPGSSSTGRPHRRRHGGRRPPVPHRQGREVRPGRPGARRPPARAHVASGRLRCGQRSARGRRPGPVHQPRGPDGGRRPLRPRRALLRADDHGRPRPPGRGRYPLIWCRPRRYHPHPSAHPRQPRRGRLPHHCRPGRSRWSGRRKGLSRRPVRRSSDYHTTAVSRCLEFGNFGARAFPEQVEAWVDTAVAYHARRAETALLDGIAAGLEGDDVTVDGHDLGRPRHRSPPMYRITIHVWNPSPHLRCRERRRQCRPKDGHLGLGNVSRRT